MGDKATYAIFKLGAILVRVIKFHYATDCKIILKKSNTTLGGSTSSPLTNYDFPVSPICYLILDRISLSVVLTLQLKLTATRPP